MFFPWRRTDDDPATDRKVASLLETVNKIKWKPADSLDGPEEKVQMFVPVLPSLMSLLETNGDTQLPYAPPPPNFI